MNKRDLGEILNSCGSDKNNYHNYGSFYNLIFHDLRDKEVFLFELGLGSNDPTIKSTMGTKGVPCGSLYAWKEYFPQGHIFGADIDKNTLVYNDDIKTYHCDQTKPEDISQMFNNNDLKNISFDVIIDDGLHNFEANLTFLNNSIQKLKAGGIYIIEDLLPVTVVQFFLMKYTLMSKYSLNVFELISMRVQSNLPDNTLLVIRK